MYWRVEGSCTIGAKTAGHEGRILKKKLRKKKRMELNLRAMEFIMCLAKHQFFFPFLLQYGVEFRTKLGRSSGAVCRRMEEQARN